MDTEQMRRLEGLIQQHDEMDKDPTVGTFYLGWGSFILVGMFLFTLWLDHAMFWVFWIPLGLVVQAFIIRRLKRQAGSESWQSALVSATWIICLLGMPIVTWFFPYVLGVYQPGLTFSAVCVWLSLGAWAAGLAANQLPMKVGSLAFLAAAPLYLLLPAHQLLVFSFMIAGALIIPGALCHHAHQRR